MAIFMYMRLIGYPAEKIAILTTYNGQKHLIRDVIRQRCANNPLIGQPSKVNGKGGRLVEYSFSELSFLILTCITSMYYAMGISVVLKLMPQSVMETVKRFLKLILLRLMFSL